METPIETSPYLRLPTTAAGNGNILQFSNQNQHLAWKLWNSSIRLSDMRGHVIKSWMIYFLTLKRFSCLMIKLGSCAMLGRNNDLPLSSLNILVGKMTLAASHLLFFICDKRNQ